VKVLKTKVLRRIIGPGRDEATGEWRKLHNEELHDLFASPSVCPVTKSRKMRQAGHVARMGEESCIEGFCVAKQTTWTTYGMCIWEDNI
jgi:hypothetical protein